MPHTLSIEFLNSTAPSESNPESNKGSSSGTSLPIIFITVSRTSCLATSPLFTNLTALCLSFEDIPIGLRDVFTSSNISGINDILPRKTVQSNEFAVINELCASGNAAAESPCRIPSRAARPNSGLTDPTPSLSMRRTVSSLAAIPSHPLQAPH